MQLHDSTVAFFFFMHSNQEEETASIVLSSESLNNDLSCTKEGARVESFYGSLSVFSQSLRVSVPAKQITHSSVIHYKQIYHFGCLFMHLCVSEAFLVSLGRTKFQIG